MIRKHTAVGALVLAMATSFAIAASAQNTNAAPQAKAEGARGVDKGEARGGDKGDKAHADKGDKAHADKGDKAGDKGDKGDKAGDKGDKAGDKGDKAGDKGDKAKSADDRAARREKERAALRSSLTSTWKGAPSDALRQELSRHAERLARLERIKEVADTEKDKDTSDKAEKLITKENERHDKWMTKHAPPPGAATAAAAPGTNPAANDVKKEGAQ